jgi:peptidoglycan hydrolase-like protein with peptidoglycan-binding domain
MPTLQLGDTGAEVSDLQDRLYQLGYDLYGSGQYDTYTQEAVRRFQTDYGLEPTGVADDDTLGYVNHYTASAPTESPVAAAGTPGTAQVLDQSGNVLAQATPQQVDRQGDVADLSDTVRDALETILKSNPMTAPYAYAIELANALGWTVAVGLDEDLAGVIGLTEGIGLYFGPGNTWGIYRSIGGDLGAVIGASGAACWTVVNGGPDKLGGVCWAIEASAGELLVGGGSVLFTLSGEFLGVACELGIGAGIPANAFASLSYTHLQQF